MKSVYLSLFAALSLLGCEQTSLSSLPLQEQLQQAAAFELEMIDGQTVEQFLADSPTPRRASTLNFQAEPKLTGRAGCNRFFGNLEWQGQRITLGKAGSTSMLCPPAQMVLEQRILSTLQHGADVSLEGERLTLKGDKVELVYKRVQLEK